MCHSELPCSLYLKSLPNVAIKCIPVRVAQSSPKIQAKFTELLDDHEDAIVSIGKGLHQIQSVYPKFQISQFLNHLKERITMKLLVTHYLSLIGTEQR
ncbi:AVN_HP_G0120050.mRNA.1.CDS.1 [Saccharomyces cerevisiae]|nr:AVN_HP_G0120050.mRNA.1.CDS.1 [Saccharomyces cerevisiae]CAI6997142.1 AVN_HP_G0120050.mRNA.1.CDS.1 [Saccharomyces cerevisiae]